MDKILRFLSGVGVWIKRTFSELVSAPGIIWKWSEASTRNRLIALGGAVIAAAMLFTIIHYYIRMFKSKRRESPFALVFILAVICGGMWFARHEIVRYQMPEAESVRVEGDDLLIYDRYSLAPGFIPLQDSEDFMTPSWRIVDDTVTWRLDERRILQLTGLQSLSAERDYALVSMEHGSRHSVSLNHQKTGPYEKWQQTLDADLWLFIFPDRQLTGEPWYLESGSEIRAESIFEIEELWSSDSVSFAVPETDYKILENDGERVVFLAFHSGKWLNVVGIARQMGPDLVVGISYATANRWIDGADSGNHHVFDPLTDPEEREVLYEPLAALFDGRIRLIRDPSEELAAQLLPDRIVSYPIPLCDCPSFTIPLRELVEMNQPHYDYPTNGYTAEKLLFIGEGPDGQAQPYSLVNGASVRCNSATDEQLATLIAWDEAYQKGKSSPDDVISDWIGVPAVPFEGGWLMRTGSYFGGYPEYYYLTAADESAPAEAENDP